MLEFRVELWQTCLDIETLIRMGRSFWFECARCGYRAKVSGRADRGIHLFVQTILCRDCKELYDAVTRIRVPLESAGKERKLAPRLRSGGRLNHATPKVAPSFLAAVNRLTVAGMAWSDWFRFKPQCPVSATHRVQSWNAPDVCPRCGLYLERNVLPYRIWE